MNTLISSPRTPPATPNVWEHEEQFFQHPPPRLSRNKSSPFAHLSASFMQSTRKGGELFECTSPRHFEGLKRPPYGSKKASKYLLSVFISFLSSSISVRLQCTMISLIFILSALYFCLYVFPSNFPSITIFLVVPILAVFTLIGVLATMMLVSYFFAPRRILQNLLRALEAEKCRLRSDCKPHRIILIRHGESQGNTDKNVYKDVPDSRLALTEKGRLQAQGVGKAVRTLIGDGSVRFIVSPYARSMQTLDNIIIGGDWAEHSYTVREDARLREQDWGNFQDPEQVKCFMDERRRFGAFYYRFPHGESGADVFDRASSFWATLNRDFDRQLQWDSGEAPEHYVENYVIISHGITLRLLLMKYFGWTVEEFHLLWNLENCQMVLMEKQPNGTYMLKQPLKRNPRASGRALNKYGHESEYKSRQHF